MQLNFFLCAAIAAFVPLIVGSVWYHPKVFGTTWMKANGFEDAKMKQGFNMPLVFGLAYFFGFLISIPLSGLVIHQIGIFGMMNNHLTEAPTVKIIADAFDIAGNDFRSFKHGALHGAFAGIGLALPIVGINAMFERRSAKYILIHAGYWILTLILMGGFLCQFVDLKSMS